MMDINTVSAGGGTIAKVDRFGALEVGPESAGAVPGPACYSRGGKVPTITDCNLLLGYFGEDNFLGGKMHLDAAKARKSIEDVVCKPLAMERGGCGRRHRAHHRCEDGRGDQGYFHHARA